MVLCSELNNLPQVVTKTRMRPFRGGSGKPVMRIIVPFSITWSFGSAHQEEPALLSLHLNQSINFCWYSAKSHSKASQSIFEQLEDNQLSPPELQEVTVAGEKNLPFVKKPRVDPDARGHSLLWLFGVKRKYKKMLSEGEMRWSGTFVFVCLTILYTYFWIIHDIYIVVFYVFDFWHYQLCTVGSKKSAPLHPTTVGSDVAPVTWLQDSNHKQHRWWLQIRVSSSVAARPHTWAASAWIPPTSLMSDPNLSDPTPPSALHHPKLCFPFGIAFSDSGSEWRLLQKKKKK